MAESFFPKGILEMVPRDILSRNMQTLILRRIHGIWRYRLKKTGILRMHMYNLILSVTVQTSKNVGGDTWGMLVVTKGGGTFVRSPEPCGRRRRARGLSRVVLYVHKVPPILEESEAYINFIYLKSMRINHAKFVPDPKHGGKPAEAP